jgi:hypothetical protein
MFPEDRVLVGVIKRKRDLNILLNEYWYRIPQAQMPRGVNVEYVAFFLSGSVFKERKGGVHYFARRTGLELHYRRELLPKEPDHPRADNVYYQVQFEDVREKKPPILNPTRRSLAFIHTTWDRFVNATLIADLYSTADYYVDRIYHALRSSGIQPDRYWEAERKETGLAPQLRILCQNGTVIASSERDDNSIFLDIDQPEDAILAKIRADIASKGGVVMINLPFDE